MVTNKTKFNVNDIVVCYNYGELYSTYSTAMSKLWGCGYHGFSIKEHQYSNGIMGRSDFDVRYDSTNYWHKKKWRIVAMCVHEDSSDVLCQLCDELKRNILVGVSGLKLIKHNPKNITKQIPKINYDL